MPIALNSSWAARSCVARVDAAVLAAQPLAVEQVRAGELGTQPGPAEPLDRLAVQALGGLAVAQQRPRARLDPERPVGAARLRSPPSARSSASARERRSRRSGRPPRSARSAPRRRRTARGVARPRVCGRGERLLVAAEAVEEDRARPVGVLDAGSLAAGGRPRGSCARSAPRRRPRGLRSAASTSGAVGRDPGRRSPP